MTEKEAKAPLIGKMKNNRDKKGNKKGATMLGRLGSREVESFKDLILREGRSSCVFLEKTSAHGEFRAYCDDASPITY